MDILTTGCGLLAAWAAAPAFDAFLRWRRLAAPQGGARDESGTRAPRKILAVIPSRAEGARVGDLAGDLKRESEREEKEKKEKISSKVEEAGAADGASPVVAAPRGCLDVLVLLDGPDPDAEARLAREGVEYLSKKSPGPSKGHALAFVAEELAQRLDSYDFIVVFDADMRLPEGFFRDLNVPEGTEAFQLPVRPSGVPAPGAPRVEALSLAEARLDDAARDAESLPVRLRGKAMGLTPRTFRLGPAAATRTTAEDSEATLALLAKGVAVRALRGPFAFDEPTPAATAMARSRARWFGGHLKLLATGFGDLARCFVRKPLGTFVLACDLWLRPRLFVLLSLAFLAAFSDIGLLFFSSKGAWTSLGAGTAGAAAGAMSHAATGGGSLSARPITLLVFLFLLSFEAKATLAFEWLSLVALRRHIGYPSEVPPVSVADLLASLSMWVRAAGRALLAPSRWHRARPPA
ncbi:MAG TPA: glycosyltransferase family 2 protein [Thermoanaerobaculia bacterium]|nr:glycosyltransferase family 2 protein [Thermoanaerobaculia bacterium]